MKKKEKIKQLKKELDNHKNAIGCLMGGLIGLKLGITDKRINNTLEIIMNQADYILRDK